MSQRTNQPQRPLKFWFPYWNKTAQTPSPERTQPQRTPTESRSSTSRQPTASSAQRSQPSDSPSPSRKSSLPTNANDPTRKQLPSKSNTPTKPSSPARLPSKLKIQDPMDSLGKPVERAEFSRQPDSFKEKKPKRDEEKKLDETKAAEIPRLKVGQADSEPKRNQGESSEEGAIVKTYKSDLDTKVKQNKVGEEEAKSAYPEPFRKDLGDSDQQKPIKKPEEFPQLTAKQSNLEPQRQTEASNQQKVHEKPEEITRMETTQTGSILRKNAEPSNEEKQHEITQNIPEVRTYQKETTEKALRISEDKPIPDLDTGRGTHKTETKTEIHAQGHSSTNGKALDSKVEREYKINGDEADEPRPKNGGTIHAAKENMADEGSTSANVKKEHELSEKGNKISISTGPLVAFADGERADFQKEIKEGLSKLVGKLNIGHSGNLRADSGVCIITLAGKNKGAIMKIGNATAKGTKKSTDETKHNDERLEMAVNISSNVQSINNSLLNESNCKEKSPGVHLVLSAKPTDGTGLKKKVEMLVSKNSSLNIPTPQKLLSYEPPNVRRRCLRGLMMEPSEDEEDGAQKPRRHGCRVGVGCDDKRKEKEDIDEISSKPN